MLGVWPPGETPPIWKSENEQPEHVSHWASEAAIFIGCRSVTRMPKALPNIRFRLATGTSTISASFAAGLKVSAFLRRAKCPHPTPKTTAAPAAPPARGGGGNPQTAHPALR